MIGDVVSRDVKLKSKWRGQPKVISCHVKLADENVHAFEIDVSILHISF